MTPKVGSAVTPRTKDHPLFLERGEVFAWFPSGAAGISDPEGVLWLRMKEGRCPMVPASEWMELNVYQPKGATK